jgi:hypothetical protein
MQLYVTCVTLNCSRDDKSTGFWTHNRRFTCRFFLSDMKVHLISW